MGVERSVTRWYLRRQLLLTEITQLEAQLALSSALVTGEGPVDAGHADDTKVDLKNLSLRLAVVQEELKTLGHCPRPMMG
jgi:hypothetical protein